MQRSETAKLLAKAALIDNRHIDRETVEAWHEVIGHIELEVALAALTIHRQSSTDYLMPAHIIANLRKARDAQEIEANRRRALEPPRPMTRSGMPSWFRDAIANFGKENHEAVPTGAASSITEEN